MRNFKPDKEFQYTEKRLYEFYEKLGEIERTKHSIEIAENQAKGIEWDIHNTHIYIKSETNMGIDYSTPRVQSSSKTSPQENDLINQISGLERELLEKRKDINRLRKCRRLLESAVDEMEYNIYVSPQRLSVEARELVEYKYRDHHSLQWIADKTFCSKSGVEYKRKEIVKNIMQWEKIKCKEEK